MPILVYIENVAGTFKKSAFEVVSYAKAIADASADSLVALSIGEVPTAELLKLGNYGATKILTIGNASLKNFVNQAYASLIAEVARKENASTVVLSNSFSGKGLAPRVAVKLEAALADGVIELPKINGDSWEVSKSVFSSKAIAKEQLTAATRVLALSPNAFEVKEIGGTAEIEAYEPTIQQTDLSTVIQEIVRATDKVSLPEAEIVVSAGRGLKGPENWAMVEELAEVLGAATACSKPVSDAGWRPHEEHVGQTGIAVSPNLYIAIGISGAIQHLAGVSSSKTIVVINSDAEAPFFKVADYGIVGDAFVVVPQLIQALKAYKNQ